MADSIVQSLSTPTPVASTPVVEPKQASPETPVPNAAVKAIEQEIKENKKKYKLKVDKGEEDFELDLNNDEEVKKHLQKSRAADKRFQEAAEVRKAAMDFIEQLRKNPRKVLSDPSIGVDVKKFAEDILNGELAELEKSPEQRELDKAKAELESLKQEAKEREETGKKTEFARLQAEQERYLETEISSALDIGGLPKTPRTVARMAEMMEIALKNNIDIGPKDIIKIVKDGTMGEFKEIVASLSDDQLEDFLGKEVLGRLRKKNVAKAKLATTASSIKQTGNNVKAPVKAESEKKLTIKQFLGA